MMLYWPLVSEGIAKDGEYGNDRGAGHTPRYHQGVDGHVGVGTTIYASGSGRVTEVSNSGRSTGFGLSVVVRYDDGERVDVRNSHMSSVAVGVGDEVRLTTELGRSGGLKGSFGAGSATGPHDHIEVLVNGRRVDPLSRLSWRSTNAGSGTPIEMEQEVASLQLVGNADNKQGQLIGIRRVPVPAEQDYKLLYRLINSDQTKSPFEKTGSPETFTSGELRIIDRYLAAVFP